MKDNVVNILVELPAYIFKAENDVIAAQYTLQKAKDCLADREAELLLSGEINGKNAELRQAQLRQLTESERAAVNDAEVEMLKARANLNKLMNESKCLRSAANILAGEVD